MLAEEEKTSENHSLKNSKILLKKEPIEPPIFVKMKNGINDGLDFLNPIIHLIYNIPELNNLFLNTEFPFEYKFNVFNQLQLILVKYKKLSNSETADIFDEKTNFVNGNDFKNEIFYSYNSKYVIHDPIDILFILFNFLHNYSLDVEDFTELSNIRCKNKNCFSHNLFHFELYQQCYCLRCNAISDLYSFGSYQYFYEINKKLTTPIYLTKEKFTFKILSNKLFSLEKDIYSKYNLINYIDICKCDCPEKLLIKNICLNYNKYFFVSLLTDRFKAKDLSSTYNLNLFTMIPVMFNPFDLFTIYILSPEKKNYYLIFILLIKNVSNHKFYSLLCYHKIFECFLYYDNDKFIHFNKYKNFVEYAIINNYVPLLLIYSNEIENYQTIDEKNSNEINEQEYNQFLNFAVTLDREKKMYEENDQSFTKIKPKNELRKVEGEELKEILDRIRKMLQKRALYEGIDSPELLFEINNFINSNVEKNSKIDIDAQKKKLVDKTKEWVCEKCQNINKIINYRCVNCNYFNYDVYSGNYLKESQLIAENIENAKKNKPIIIDEKDANYNFKEEYESKREEKHKFIKCWHCGKENMYYKVKCNYCRFPIHDSEEPKIIKTQLTEYDITHGIKYNIKNKNKITKKESKKKFKEIKIKYQPIKEAKKYEELSGCWTCKFCKKINSETGKFCSFCFKNRF